MSKVGFIGEPGSGINFLCTLYLKDLGFKNHTIYVSDANEYIPPNEPNSFKKLVTPDLQIIDLPNNLPPGSFSSPIDFYHYLHIHQYDELNNPLISRNNLRKTFLLKTDKIDKITQNKLSKLFFIKRRISNLIHYHQEYVDENNLAPNYYNDFFKLMQRDYHYYESFLKYDDFLKTNFSMVCSLSMVGIEYFAFNSGALDKDIFRDYIKQTLNENYRKYWVGLDNEWQEEAIKKVKDVLARRKIPIFLEVDYNDVFYHHKTNSFLDNYKQEISNYTKTNRQLIQRFNEEFDLSDIYG